VALRRGEVSFLLAGGLALLLFLLARGLFRLALRSYTSASS
jgi:ABC-2 type transport system permease protein